MDFGNPPPITFGILVVKVSEVYSRYMNTRSNPMSIAWDSSNPSKVTFLNPVAVLIVVVLSLLSTGRCQDVTIVVRHADGSASFCSSAEPTGSECSSLVSMDPKTACKFAVENLQLETRELANQVKYPNAKLHGRGWPMTIEAEQGIVDAWQTRTNSACAAFPKFSKWVK